MVRGQPLAQGVPRPGECIFHPCILQLPAGRRRNTPSRQLSGLETCEGAAAEKKEETKGTQDYNRKGVLFQPNYSRFILRSTLRPFLEDNNNTTITSTRSPAVKGVSQVFNRHALLPCSYVIFILTAINMCYSLMCLSLHANGFNIPQFTKLC